MDVHKIIKNMDRYVAEMIPAENAFPSSLLLKLIAKKRKSHIMDLSFDEKP